MEASEAIEVARSHAACGADIIDIGGESTRPGFTAVDAESECARVIPVVAAVRKQTDKVISIDTTKPAVLRDAISHGADMLNCVGSPGEELFAIAIAEAIPVVIMHNKEQPCYVNVVDEVLTFLYSSALKALALGMKEENIILDPGIGFGKTPENNVALLQSLDRLVALGFPTLIGTSRKSTIGKITGRQVNERAYGTAATVALAIAAGIDIVRVHDVSAMVDVVKVSDCIVRNWRPLDWECAQ
jgi:dihydropteroate synthase